MTISDSFFTLTDNHAQMVSSTDNFSAVITHKHNEVAPSNIAVTLSTTESIHYNSDDPIGGKPLFTLLFYSNPIIL